MSCSQLRDGRRGVGARRCRRRARRRRARPGRPTAARACLATICRAPGSRSGPLGAAVRSTVTCDDRLRRGQVARDLGRVRGVRRGPRTRSAAASASSSSSCAVTTTSTVPPSPPMPAAASAISTSPGVVELVERGRARPSCSAAWSASSDGVTMNVAVLRRRRRSSASTPPPVPTVTDVLDAVDARGARPRPARRPRVGRRGRCRPAASWRDVERVLPAVVEEVDLQRAAPCRSVIDEQQHRRGERDHRCRWVREAAGRYARCSQPRCSFSSASRRVVVGVDAFAGWLQEPVRRAPARSSATPAARRAARR